MLYGANGSGSSLVECVLLELGADFEVRILDARRGAHREPHYRAINPHGKMPTLLTPQGETLTESAAIVLTLVARHPEAELMPTPGSPEHALALRWLIFVVAELYPVVEIMDHPERFTPDESEGAQAGVRERAHAMWRARWQIVEDALGEGPYLLGDRFCATDVFLGGLSRWDLPRDWRLEHLPKLERLATAVKGRPRLRDAWPRHFPYP